MRSFEVVDESPREFVDRVHRAIEAKGHRDVVSVGLRDEHMVVSFRWMGSSELRFTVEARAGGGFRAILTSQRMSPWHAPFHGAIEDRFDAVISELGAAPLAD